MTLVTLILLVAGVIGLLIIFELALRGAFGADPDLNRPDPWMPDGSWFGRERDTCGAWKDEPGIKHVHAGWNDRRPR